MVSFIGHKIVTFNVDIAQEWIISKIGVGRMGRMFRP
jgi:hypothetical protein